ncbi:hypothetical protein JYU34_022836 [Plutella xylostella]|uniref:DUF8207 domain-containing protein n=1 Tax=Plutella xylostella TaxID=51655 RepID=A0ABQ7PP72_PLUXY|nr:hypothetical protein JYU34_022836 [Plutella xylostella]
MNDEKTLKQQIIKSADAVKKKMQSLKNSKLDSDMALESMFKPVTDPLKQLTRNYISAGGNDEIHQESESEDVMPKITFPRKRKLSENEPISNLSPNKIQHDINSDHSLSDSELEQSTGNNISDLFFETTSDAASTPTPKSVSSWSLSSEVFNDVPYGIRLEKGKPMIGSERVTITDHSIKIAGQSYSKTRGLVELLYQKKPDLSIVTEEDKQNYKSMLLSTNAHKRKYDLSQPTNSNRGFKYLQIIKPLLASPTVTKSTHLDKSTPKGKGIPLFKKVGKNVDYIFWNDPNDLVETLKLLIASRDAGNTGLDDEILSIIKQLKKCGDIN